MAFDVSGLSTWSQELSERKDWIIKVISGSTSLKYLTKFYGIQGQNQRIPQIESTAPAQSGYGCGFTTSGTTTISQKTITTVPFTVQEAICLRDLHQYFTLQTLPNTSLLETWQLADIWINRKLQQVSQKLGMAIWQGRTTYTNDTFLKLQNGFIRTIDNASDEIIITNGGAGTAITTSNVRTIFEEGIFNKDTGLLKVPQTLEKNPIAFCGRDTFFTLRLKLMQDNLYHVPIGNADSPDGAYNQWEMYYPGSTIKVVGIPELNSSNPVETGSLPTAVTNRVVITYPENLWVGMNGEGDATEFRVWYSQDNDQLRFSLRGFVGVQVPFTDHVVTY